MKNDKKDNTFIFTFIISLIIHIIVFSFVFGLYKNQGKKLNNNSDFNFKVSYAVKKSNKKVQTNNTSKSTPKKISKSKVASTVRKVTTSKPKQNIRSGVYKKKEKKRVFAEKKSSFDSAKYREELRKKYIPTKDEKKYTSNIPKTNTEFKKDDLKEKQEDLNPNVEILTGNEQQTEPFNEISQIESQQDEYDEQDDNLIIPDVESLSNEGKLSILPALSEEITRKQAIQTYEENNSKLSKQDLKRIVFVLVSFKVSDSGNPKDIKFISKSGSEQVDNAISSLVSLMTFSNEKKYLPILIFASGKEQKENKKTEQHKNTIQLKKVDNIRKVNTVEIPKN